MQRGRLVLCALAFSALLTSPALAAENDYVLADKAREVLRKHCAACHDGKAPRGDLNVLNFDQLVRPDRLVVKAREPAGSELLQLIDCGTMPPGQLPKVPEQDRTILNQWIGAGALPFAPLYSERYALTKILRDVQAAGQNPADYRYITLNHLLADEKSAADLKLYRAALRTAINQLSTRSKLVELSPIDPDATIFRIKLSELGWDLQPYKDSRANLFDLLLLDYPLASLPERSSVADAVISEYLVKVNLVRPIPYVRGDWLISAATQAPLYEDMLRLPKTFTDLQKRAGVDPSQKTAHAKLASAVVNGNRVLERQSRNDAFLWRTYDQADSVDAKVGGEAIFRLPNGLPAYFIADGRDMRQEEIPDALLRQPLQKSHVRNGLSCISCHESGLKKVDDAALSDLIEQDSKGFAAALRDVHKDSPEPEPVGPASRRFLETALRRGLEPFTLVRFDVQRSRPSVWDHSYVSTDPGGALARVHQGGILPAVLPAVDSQSQATVAGPAATASFTVATIDPKAGTAPKEFQPKGMFAIEITNTGKKDMHFELVFTQPSGRVVVVPTGKQAGKLGVLEAGETVRIRPAALDGYPVPEIDPGEWARLKCTVYAADAPFPPGVVLSMADKRAGESVADRFVHTLYKIEDGRIETKFDAAKIVKQTITMNIAVK